MNEGGRTSVESGMTPGTPFGQVGETVGRATSRSLGMWSRAWHGGDAGGPSILARIVCGLILLFMALLIVALIVPIAAIVIVLAIVRGVWHLLKALVGGAGRAIIGGDGEGRRNVRVRGGG